ncbi:G2/mitotic-specific cyclin-B-like [Amphiura filiformis]|uniref:G2/mitotic-specific cyclin-B-like n=1 Tax=Amphiura filiformis TaxID=82378 RepID=UPI003B223FC0
MAMRVRAGLNTFGIENANVNLPGKAATKSFVTKQTNGRRALGAIDKNVVSNQSGESKKVNKKDTRPTRGMTKSKATSSLQSVIKDEKITSTRVKSPEPMDMESVSNALAAFSSEQLLIDIEDIDKNDHDNPQLCSIYVNDIYKYLRHLEFEFKVRADYMNEQEINARMRTILVDWLVQVHLRFHLLQETLFLTVQLIDRYLQVQSVSKSKLQLVGVTAMFIAAKYEEMYPPEINDFVYITDNAYSKSQIRTMEMHMLESLHFALGKPLCLHFLRRNSKAGGADAQKHTLAKYLMELTLPEYDFVQYDPSEIAAAALNLAMQLLEPDVEWSTTLAHYSNYTDAHLAPIVTKMAILVQKSVKSKYQAVRTKFASSKFMRISGIPELKSSRITELAEDDS